MNKKQKKVFYKIIISGLLLMLAFFLQGVFYLRIAMIISSYLIIGFDVLRKSFRNICKGQVFDENFLMLIATIGAFVIGEYNEAVFVMLFYQFGELFESIAVGKSRKSISDLMKICPEYVNVERDGEIITVDPEEVSVGDIVVVKPGEKIPVDGCIVEGEGNIDTANLTGEAVPRFAKQGDSVISGCINIGGVLQIRAEKEFCNSTVSRILEMVENASTKKSVSEKFITRFAKYYTPVVVVSAIVLAVVPSLIFGSWQEWLKCALVFLVVSCPCALVISVPLSFFCGIGCASKNGVLIKGSNYIEALSRCNTIVFDKTGTLTKGVFKVTEVMGEGYTADELLRIAAHGEKFSNHPVAVSVCKAYDSEYDGEISQLNELAGKGIEFILDGINVLAGSSVLLEENGLSVPQKMCTGTVVYVAVDNRYAGYIAVEDSLKDNVKSALNSLRRCGITKQVMLSGDNRVVAEAVGEEVGLDEVKSELLPSDKVTALEGIIGINKGSGTVAYVGDGVNDAPVISRADVGIAMGAMGSDAAIEAADIVLMDDRIEKIPFVIKLTKKTMGIVKQNIIFALGIKFFVMISSLFGFSNMWLAVFADVGVSFVAILNAMRLLGLKMEKLYPDLTNR